MLDFKTKFPEIGDILFAKPNIGVGRVLQNIYEEDPTLAVFREYLSNSFQHGETDTAYIFLKDQQLMFVDDGLGFIGEKIKYLFLQDFGEQGQPEEQFNHWRVGLLSALKIANRIIFHSRSVSGEFKVEVSQADSEFTILTKRLPITEPRKKDGLTVTMFLTDTAKKELTPERLEFVLKRVCYWWVRHENKNIYFNNQRIQYGDQNALEGMYCEEEFPLKNVESSPENPVEGDVFYRVAQVPKWAPPKCHILLYAGGNYIRDQRVFWGGFDSLVIVNTQDPAILKKLSAGKMSVEGITNTGLFRALDKFAARHRRNTSTPDDEILRSVINEFLILMDTRSSSFGDKTAKIIENFKKQNKIENNIKKDYERNELSRHRDLPVERIHDVNCPFFGILISGEKRVITINSLDDDGLVYPILTEKINSIIANPTSKNTEFLIPFISRLSDALCNIKEYLDNTKLFCEKWIREDRKIEIALTKRKRIDDHIDEETFATCDSHPPKNAPMKQAGTEQAATLNTKPLAQATIEEKMRGYLSLGYHPQIKRVKGKNYLIFRRGDSTPSLGRLTPNLIETALKLGIRLKSDNSPKSE